VEKPDLSDVYLQVRMKQQLRRQPARRGPRVLRRASTVRGGGGVSAPSMRSIRSGYAFSHQQGFGELITTGSMMSVRPRPRSARIKGPLPRYGQQRQQQQQVGVTETDLDEVDDERRRRRSRHTVRRSRQHRLTNCSHRTEAVHRRVQIN